MQGIKKFYKRQSIDLIMFGHVSALINNLPFSTEKAILNFMNLHKLTDSDVNVESLKKTYFRMQKELIDTYRTDE